MTLAASPDRERVVRPKRARHLSEAMRCETAFRLILSECLEEVATNHEALSSGDPAALHQTRIALTRLKAAIAFYGAMVADSEWTRLKSELKWLSAHLGATRDLDVAIENSKGLPEERMLQTARTDAFDALREALQSDRYWQWFDGMWTGSAAAPGPRGRIPVPRNAARCRCRSFTRAGWRGGMASCARRAAGCRGWARTSGTASVSPANGCATPSSSRRAACPRTNTRHGGSS
ncbi:CHAD domain-containing protein [Bradyrhizobium sp. 13971]